jgi:hypothetical protein
MNGLIKDMKGRLAELYGRKLSTGKRASFPQHLDVATLRPQSLSLTHLQSIGWRTQWTDPNSYTNFTMKLTLSADYLQRGYPEASNIDAPISMTIAHLDYTNLAAVLADPSPPPPPAMSLPGLVALMDPSDSTGEGLFRPIRGIRGVDEAATLLQTWEEEIAKQQKGHKASLGILPLITNPPHPLRRPRFTKRFFVTVTL